MTPLAIPIVVLVADAVTGAFAQPRGEVEASAMADFISGWWRTLRSRAR